MTDIVDAKQKTGIMSRLASNQEGNIIAILAAAVVPVIGLVGGAVDMSRIYLTQSRLQGACDAGALLGRKTMGVGTWAANSGAANTQAMRIFDQNFESGAYGSNSLTRTFTESGGNVVGTASTVVPMALMQVLGQGSKTINVRCQAELRVPNTDVMFVLDTTGSMGDPASGSTESKISGLRKAVKCFYEALAKKNITDVAPADCGETVDPSATNVGAVQLRFGFVPYATNINVGQLLPLSYMADQWTYQSREAAVSGSATAAYGTESGATTISSVDSPVTDSAWQDTGQDVTQNGVTYFWSASVVPSACPTTGPSSGSISIPGTNTLVSQSPATPVEPDATLTRTYQRTTANATRSYQYIFNGDRTKTNKKEDCKLQFRDTGRSDRTITTRTVTPITWNPSTTFAGWTYKPVTFNVSSLKDTGANAYRTSIQLPLGTYGASTSVAWTGCIEERQTFRGPDNNPLDDWSPIPATAYDMNIDMLPTADPATKWGPSLPSAICERYLVTTSGSGVNSLSTTRTLNNIFIGKNDAIIMNNPYSSCPSAARKFAEWTPTDFRNYINDLSIGGFTSHDSGMLWGARIMSPTGIFASLNAPQNVVIERHMVFMTDGETNVLPNVHSPYGVPWYDRRQTPLGTDPINTQLNNLADARTAALCTEVKNKDINLWVVSYGNVASATNDRLRACASPGKFFEATSVSSLVANFKAIAAEISALRLTQ